MNRPSPPVAKGIDPDADSPIPPRRRISSAVVLGLVALGSVLALAVALQLFVARHIPELTEFALDAAERRWAESGPDSYDVDLVIRGAQPGTVHVEVRNGEVTAFQRDGVAPRQRRTWDVWSVSGQFEMIERELELAADPEHEMHAEAGTRLSLRCDFDAEYGFPREFHRVVYGGGPEVYWRVTNFQPRK